MKPSTKARIAREGGKLVSDLIKLGMAKPKTSSATESQEEAPETTEPTITTPEEPASPPTISAEGEKKPSAREAVATACVPCALGHFSTSAGLLNEAVRFKAEGITSTAIMDRIAKVLAEQNALERVDLTPEKIRSAPDWERDIAEEALEQSRALRHRLETIETIEQLEQAAADTAGYYRDLHRAWWKLRFAKLEKAEPEIPIVSEIEAFEKRLELELKKVGFTAPITLEEAKALAAESAAKEVERRWKEKK